MSRSRVNTDIGSSSKRDLIWLIGSQTIISERKSVVLTWKSKQVIRGHNLSIISTHYEVQKVRNEKPGNLFWDAESIWLKKSILYQPSVSILNVVYTTEAPSPRHSYFILLYKQRQLAYSQ